MSGRQLKLQKNVLKNIYKTEKEKEQRKDHYIQR